VSAMYLPPHAECLNRVPTSENTSSSRHLSE
jgi:hypothetical protein